MSLRQSETDMTGLHEERVFYSQQFLRETFDLRFGFCFGASMRAFSSIAKSFSTISHSNSPLQTAPSKTVLSINLWRTQNEH